jgi:predicted dinucleotide-utilizing enzyme
MKDTQTLARNAQHRVDALVIETLALSESELRDRVVELKQDAESYRLLASVALERVAALTRLVDRQHDRIVAVVLELREFRATASERAA